MNKRRPASLCYAFVFGVLLVQWPFPAIAQEVLHLGFESGNLDDWSIESGNDSRVKLVCAADGYPVRDGQYAVQFTLGPDGVANVGGERAEIRRSKQKDAFGTDYWYSWSSYIDPAYWNDEDKGFLIIAQWHATKDKESGEVSRSPPRGIARTPAPAAGKPAGQAAAVMSLEKEC